MTALGIASLCKRFGASQPNVLDDINLEIESGEFLILLGPSGCGKTTLLRAIAGLLDPTQGTIRLGEDVIFDHASRTNCPAYERNLGMVFQSFALWPHMTIEQNVAYPLRARHWKSSEIAPRVQEMLRLVRCDHLAKRLPSTLSGGQQQRVSLARALAGRPSLVLFDEPLSNLDALLRLELRAQLRLIHRETGLTGVFVTHDQSEAMSLGTRLAVMNGGKIEQIGAPEEIYAQPQTEFVSEFMGMANRVLLDAPIESGGRKSGDGGFAMRFRPEHVIVDGDAADSDRVVLGQYRVIDRAFQGDSIELVLEDCSDIVKASLPAAAGEHPIGSVKTCSVLRSAARCFPVARGGASA